LNPAGFRKGSGQSNSWAVIKFGPVLGQINNLSYNQPIMLKY
jgi:hypothetical protein